MARRTLAHLSAELEVALVRVQQLERELHESRELVSQLKRSAPAQPVVRAQRTFMYRGVLCAKVLVDQARHVYAIRPVEVQ